jgi:hypothetical protein
LKIRAFPGPFSNAITVNNVGHAPIQITDPLLNEKTECGQNHIPELHPKSIKTGYVPHYEIISCLLAIRGMDDLVWYRPGDSQDRQGLCHVLFWCGSVAKAQKELSICS